MNTTATTDNVDAAEIAKFAALASRWWDPASEFRPLHEINPLRLDFIDEHTPLAGQQVLDVGCGGGILTEAMASRGAVVTGIDAGATPLAVARLHLKESGLEVSYQQQTAEQFAENGNHRFDIVTCMELLEHVPDPSLTVAACSRLVKPGGAVYFATINRTPKAWLLAIVGAEYILNLLPRGTHSYEKFIRPSELDTWCRGNALSTSQLIGLHYNPVTGKYRLAPGVDVNYIAHAVRGQT
ncbi:MAG: bifunctional 2-polyprenyl-6-hydroxyphenol methylase/3-demethylubiquinol 3-O-methyltransferase UbiG [Gammaproteobacteria bacterium]|nr:bifunctional 2-polyprenyl-6-hydroxyphenol methylase/3-demethylubiquinol 3-O-methyltransferase UbiG [Gammaproteobacteria bacterium]MDH3466496.1 bifunctional 2-polyprenyl-6-hydroxyphenol methylase/3-demethylubiquinol 3-O-methyltransferase UbiG [Gammaproteobacteria bacterium]